MSATIRRRPVAAAAGSVSAATAVAATIKVGNILANAANSID